MIRAGERTFAVAEEFGLDQVLGQIGAVKFDQRIVGTRRHPVYLASDFSFARSSLTSNQDVVGPACYSHYLVAHSLRLLARLVCKNILDEVRGIFPNGWQGLSLRHVHLVVFA